MRAEGDLILTGIHFEAGRSGQSNQVRLALWLKRKEGALFVDHRGELFPVELAPDSRSLQTTGHGGHSDPIFDFPPTPAGKRDAGGSGGPDRERHR